MFGSFLGLLVFVFFVSRFVLFVTAWAATAKENEQEEPVPVPGPGGDPLRRSTVRSGPTGGAAAGLLGAGAARPGLLGGRLLARPRRPLTRAALGRPGRASARRRDQRRAWRRSRPAPPTRGQPAAITGRRPRHRRPSTVPRTCRPRGAGRPRPAGGSGAAAGPVVGGAVRGAGRVDQHADRRASPAGWAKPQSSSVGGLLPHRHRLAARRASAPPPAAARRARPRRRGCAGRRR